MSVESVSHPVHIFVEISSEAINVTVLQGTDCSGNIYVKVLMENTVKPVLSDHLSYVSFQWNVKIGPHKTGGHLIQV